MKQYFKSQVRQLPHKPGVYLFYDSKDFVLYVGKAKDLFKRVSAYLKPLSDKRLQIPRLMFLTRKLKYLVTESEWEALILENNLIKEHQPKFNICFKDDKTYQSIKIKVNDEFPEIVSVRKISEKPGVLYFGPYCSGKDVKLALSFLIKIFQLRDCSKSEFMRRKKIRRACLKYQIKQCSGPCAGHISKTDYRNSVDQAILFLKGKNKAVLKQLKKKIDEYSKKLKFERADICYKKFQALENIESHFSNVSGLKGNSDVLGFYHEKNSVLFQILIIRNGKIISSDDFYFKRKAGDIDEKLRVFIEQYYNDPVLIPEELILSLKPENSVLLSLMVSSRSKKPFKIRLPKKGSRLKVVQMAMNNAQIKFKEHQNTLNTVRRMADLMRKLFLLSRPVYSIEGYDVSHGGGIDQVGVKVTYKDFKPDKSGYRKYHIRSTHRGDDYQSLREILSRRIESGIKNNDFPDLFLIDGGIGHLSLVKDLFEKNGIKKGIIAIAKESHSKSSFDHLYLPGRKNRLNLKRNDPVLLKLMEIRDEAHRFAITFHKKKQEKRIFGRKGEKRS